jgi:hypothetical protein
MCVGRLSDGGTNRDWYCERLAKKKEVTLGRHLKKLERAEMSKSHSGIEKG